MSRPYRESWRQLSVARIGHVNALRESCPLERSVKRAGIGDACTRNHRESRKSFLQLPKILFSLRLRIMLGRKINIHYEFVFRFKSRIHLLRVSQTMNKDA